MSYRILGFLKCRMTNAINCNCGFARDSNLKRGNTIYISWRILGRGDHNTLQTTYYLNATNAIRWPSMVMSRKDGEDINHKC